MTTNSDVEAMVNFRQSLAIRLLDGGDVPPAELPAEQAAVRFARDANGTLCVRTAAYRNVHERLVPIGTDHAVETAAQHRLEQRRQLEVEREHGDFQQLVRDHIAPIYKIRGESFRAFAAPIVERWVYTGSEGEGCYFPSWGAGLRGPQQNIVAHVISAITRAWKQTQLQPVVDELAAQKRAVDMPNLDYGLARPKAK
jgi:hypothetical protein